MTSSGSFDSANGVKPRRSQKTTTISRRWLSRTDSSPELITNSETCGERNRRSRLTRSSSSSCRETRLSSSAFQAASSAACRVIVSWYRLIRVRDATRASSSGCLKGLLTKSSAPTSRARRFSCSPLAVIITTGRNAVLSSARIRRQTSYPSRPGITMSSSTRSMSPDVRRSSASSPDVACTTR